MEKDSDLIHVHQEYLADRELYDIVQVDDAFFLNSKRENEVGSMVKF